MKFLNGIEKAERLTTNILGLLKGANGKVAQAVAGTDYATPDGVSSAVSSHDSDSGAHSAQFGAKLDATLGITTITGNTTLSASHNGKHLWCTNGSAITITVPTGLGAGFNCTIERWGAGGVTITPSGVTINGASSSVELGDQYDAAVSIVSINTNIFSVKGGIA